VNNGLPSSPEERVYAAVLNGNPYGIENELVLLLEQMPALEIVNSCLLKAMAEVGLFFESGRMQLPFVLKSAEVVKKALDILAPHMLGKEKKYRGRMVLATVKGDIHDIGKNLVDIILRSNGYQIFNLGTNQDGDAIAAAVEEHRPDHIGLSALLVKSTLEMIEILRIFFERGIQVPVICGGAALTPAFVLSALQPVYQGKVHYGTDAFAALKIMEGSSTRKSKALRPKKTTKPAKLSSALTFDNRPLVMPFPGVKTLTWDLADILPGLDKKILIKSRWRMKEGPQAGEFIE
jgi:5-methyltetrahydrofolate--homocysteine methyltransferase